MTSQEIKQMMERVWNENGVKHPHHFTRWETCGEHYHLDAKKGRKVSGGKSRRIKKQERMI